MRAPRPCIVLLITSLCAGCGSALFGSGKSRFSEAERPLFEGCSFDERGDVSSWDCSDAQVARSVEHRVRRGDPSHEGAVQDFVSSHAELGPASKSERRRVNGDDPSTQLDLTVSQHLSRMAMVASFTGARGEPRSVACIFDARPAIEGPADVVSLGVEAAMCQRRMRAIVRLSSKQ